MGKITFDESDFVIFSLVEGVLHSPYNANLVSHPIKTPQKWKRTNFGKELILYIYIHIYIHIYIYIYIKIDR